MPGDERFIDSVEAAQALFAPGFAHARHERLQVAHLDGRKRLIALRIEDAQDDRPIDLPVRRIVADAMALGSAALVLAHNHPTRPLNLTLDHA